MAEVVPPRDLVATVSLNGGGAGPDRAEATGSDAAGAPAPVMAGRYQRLELIGQGGMGVVWAARDHQLGRVVALKLVREGRSGSARLVREARALARLAHPNVVQVYDVGSLDGDTFIAMERVEGVTLRVWMKQAQRWKVVVPVLAAAARGLAAAHEAGIVHRDVKPDNVLIGRDGTVRMADFGLARDIEDDAVEAAPDQRETTAAADEEPKANARAAPAQLLLPAITREGIRVGTPGYLSPELLAGAVPDAAADQYGFGVTMHEALLGALPGQPATTARKLPGWLQRALGRTLAAPAQRWPSMAALAGELERGPVRARRRLFGALALLATAALVALMVGLSRRGSRVLSPEQRVRAVSRHVARVDAALARGASPRAEAAVDQGLALVADTPEHADLHPLFEAGARVARVRGRGAAAALYGEAAAGGQVAALLLVGEALESRKMHGRAVAPLERALGLGGDGPHGDQIRFALGRALWKADVDAVRGRALIERAERGLAATRAQSDELLVRVRAWLLRKNDK